METIKVNMNPNPLDVQTIHASQNDGEARQWGFELHNNGDAIDSSEVTDQIVFKAYKGGTEQILPENTSTPTTSPFLGDIKYPQGLLTDQEFTYRQSPTEEDGLAKITDIKGNTLNWNQLAENGDFADGVGQWQTGGANTLTVTNGVCKIQSTNTSTNNHHLVFPDPSIFQNGHTYLLRCEARAYGNMIGGSIFFAQQTNYINIGSLEGLESLTSAWQSGYLLFSRNDLTLTNGKRIVIGSLTTVTTDDYFELKNICVFDLTQMGLDISSPSEFTSLFSLPYYAYNQCTLLSFMGNGIKTVGKNQCNADDVQVGKAWNNESNSARAVLFAPIRPNTQYTISITSLGTTEGVFIVEERGIGIINGVSASLDNSTKSFTFTSKSDSKYLALQCNKTAITKSDFESVKFMLEHGATASSYEPYTSSTLSLPISTYFPTGMKDAPDGDGGKIYDELTNSKAITRVGSRAYQSGDESDTSVITDGTTTYYALATPTETSFTTASLVTENAEIPLSAENDVLIGKCTEELSAEPGFHDAKIKLTDSDGTCYSNKIQLHVERSPQ